jgi:Protein of unknown function (DUF3040)
MSLSTWEQQALDSIRDDLASCDPALAARLTLFTRLASGEQMPAREKIHVGSRRAVRRSRPGPRHTRRGYQRPGLRQAVLVLWLVSTVAVIAIALACNHGGGQGTCTRSWATFCTGATSAANSGPGHSLNIARVRGVTSAAPGRALARLAAART